MFKKRILSLDEWPLVAPVMFDVFGNSMPTLPEQSTFFAGFDNDKLAGFVHVEQLIHINTLYVNTEYQHTRLAYELIRSTNAKLETMKGWSAITLADVERNSEMNVAGVLEKHFKARPVGMRYLLRRDY